MEGYSQRYVDQLAEDLRERSSRTSKRFQISYGFIDDSDLVEMYIEDSKSYKDDLDELESLLEEANEVLDSVEPQMFENREEQLYRIARRHGNLPETGENYDWLDLHSEQETVDNERLDNESLDYRSLQRARNDTLMFAMEAAKFDEEFYELIPETDSSAELIEETVDPNSYEEPSAAVATLNAEELGRKEDSHSVGYNFIGFSNSQEEL